MVLRLTKVHIAHDEPGWALARRACPWDRSRGGRTAVTKLCGTRILARLPALLGAVLIPVLFLGVSAPSAVAETSDQASSDIAAQTEEFARQKSELLARLRDLQVKVEEAGRTVGEKANEPEIARRTIEE